jgi:hypothetical protein
VRDVVDNLVLDSSDGSAEDIAREAAIRSEVLKIMQVAKQEEERIEQKRLHSALLEIESCRQSTSSDEFCQRCMTCSRGTDHELPEMTWLCHRYVASCITE